MLAFRAALAAVLAIALVPSTVADASGTSYGIAVGVFNSPHGGNGNGWDGVLMRASGAPIYSIDGHFHELPQPDPEHRTGIMHAHFMEPGNPEPVFIAYGHFVMEIATGRGHFYVPIYRPDDLLVNPSGRLAGRFAEPVGDPTPGLGSYVAEWGISW